MNYMKQITEMLDLEWDDETQESELFKIDGLSSNYVIKPSGVFYIKNGGMEATDWLTGLLVGRGEIIKIPWKPKVDEIYYYPDIGYINKYVTVCWLDDIGDNHRYSKGLVFKTQEEAIECSNKILKFLGEEMKPNGKIK